MSEEFRRNRKTLPNAIVVPIERSRFLGRVSTFERRRNGIPAVVIRPRAPRLGFGILDAEMTGNLCKCRLALMHYGWGGLWERIWVFKEVEIAQKVMEPWRDIVAGQDLSIDIAEFSECGLGSSPVNSVRDFLFITSRAVKPYSPGV